MYNMYILHCTLYTYCIWRARMYLEVFKGVPMFSHIFIMQKCFQAICYTVSFTPLVMQRAIMELGVKERTCFMNGLEA